MRRLCGGSTTRERRHTVAFATVGTTARRRWQAVGRSCGEGDLRRLGAASLGAVRASSSFLFFSFR